jgi:hypothetical protein
MNTITKGNLQAVVDRINRITGSPMEPYTKTGEIPNQKYSANIGNYHLSGAYGGNALHQMQNNGGGVRDIFGMGHVSKRELYNLMHAFLKGMDAVTEKESI